MPPRMDEMKRRMAEAKAKQKANMDKVLSHPINVAAVRRASVLPSGTSLALPAPCSSSGVRAVRAHERHANASQVKALKALNKAAAPKSAPMPASPAPAAPAAGAKRAREDLGAELPASFDEALPKQPPGEVAAVELGAGAVGAHALVASELADANIATAPEASTCVGAVVGVGLDLGYGSSDEESEDEDMPATTTLAPEPALSAAPSGAAALPEGFFDDKSKDAVAHGKAAPKKLDIDEEFALFTEAVEEDIEALDKAEDDEIREMVETRVRGVDSRTGALPTR